MKRKHVVVGAIAAATVAGGTAGAIAAAGGGKETEQAVIEDAAKRLDVTPEELRSALGEALDAQLDAAVKTGRLTQEQADAMKERRKGVLGFGPHRGGPRGHHRGGPGGPIEDAAEALGISVRELFRRLHAGETVAEIAKAEGKDLADVEKAVGEDLLDRLGQGPPRGSGHPFRGGPPPHP